MNDWDGSARWINTTLLVIVGFIGFDTLFRLLQAQEGNFIVGLVRAISGLFLAPFEGMFADQEFLLTAIIGALGYCLLAAIVLAVVRSIQVSRDRSPGGRLGRPVAAHAVNRDVRLGDDPTVRLTADTRSQRGAQRTQRI
jgi:hypothetical protein